MLDNEIQRGMDETASLIERNFSDRLAFKRGSTRSTYTLMLRQFLTWLLHQPGHEPSFDPSADLTQITLQTYLFGELVDTSISHRECMKSMLNGFFERLKPIPMRGIEFPTQQLFALLELSTDQYYILKELIETEDLLGKAMFALGYCAGCRASDVCWFRLEQVRQLSKKSGSIKVDYKRGQLHTIDLTSEAGKELRANLEEEPKQTQRDYSFVFLSLCTSDMIRRAGDHPRRLTEGGSHAWWRTVKERATYSQWEHIADITFHDLRHDFGHRLRQACFTLEEVAVDLGYVTKKGTPAVNATARYTQPNPQ